MNIIIISEKTYGRPHHKINDDGQKNDDSHNIASFAVAWFGKMVSESIVESFQDSPYAQVMVASMLGGSVSALTGQVCQWSSDCGYADGV